MAKIKELFLSSCKELKDVKCLTLAAMFGAISIVLGSFTIMMTENIKLEWTFLPNEFVYYLFGPFVGIIYGAVMDILNYIVKPFGSFFPGFTVSAMLKGLLFGLILYKRPISLKRVITANVLRMILVDLPLNTYWLTVLNGVPYLVNLPLRALKLLIMFPVETMLFYLLVKGVEASGVLRMLGRDKEKVRAKAK
jgi:ECF transporter S component (folate family)